MAPSRLHPSRCFRARPRAVVLLALLPLGCSVYYASESSVKTLTSPFRSSASSMDEETEEAYRDDVRDFTAAWVAARGAARDFPRGLGDVARRHGVSNWEEHDATYGAVGAGLARARVDLSELHLFQRTLCGDDLPKMARIQRGFDGGGG